MNLLDYHRLRDAEVQSWNRAEIEAAAASEDPELPEKLTALLQYSPQSYAPDQFIHIRRSDDFERMRELCRLYRAAGDAQRLYIRSRVHRPVAGGLLGFGLRAAVLGARERSRDWIQLALIAFAISDLEDSDVRETLMGITLLFHCAKLAGLDPAEMFREAAAVSGPAMQAVFSDYVNRHPSLQTLGCMGWYQVDSEDGVGFTTMRPK